MLAVQEYLLGGHTLEELEVEHKVQHKHHSLLPLVLLNYIHHEKSIKNNPIASECRSLILEVGSWEIVGKGFNRFFNLGENPEYEKDFVWEDVRIEEKVDGSLMQLWYYCCQWRTSTRNTFDDYTGDEHSLHDLFWKLFDRRILDLLKQSLTLVFEIESPFMKQQANIPDEPYLTLLSVFDKGEELHSINRFYLAIATNIKSPRAYHNYGFADINDPTFEGFVLRDKNNKRLKVKNPEWFTRFQLFNNGNLANLKYLVPYILKGDEDELLCSFPFVKERADKVSEIINEGICIADEAYEKIKDFERKEVAQHIMNLGSLRALVFAGHQRKVPPRQIFREQVFVKPMINYVRQYASKHRVLSTEQAEAETE